MSDVRDAGYDDLLDAINSGDGYYLECANGHGSLPPRLACPECGSQELSEVALPDSGKVDTYTVVTVATPSFREDAPYVTAVVDFGPVRLTGQLRGITHDEVETGQVVGVDVEETKTTGDRVVVFRPR